jgi:hypothetical protein
MTKDCTECKHNSKCVNIDKFKDGDCLQYEMSIKAMNKQIESKDRESFNL